MPPRDAPRKPAPPRRAPRKRHPSPTRVLDGRRRNPPQAILRPYSDAVPALRAKFAADTFRMSETRPLDWARSGDDEVALRLAGPDVRVAMSVDKFEIFRHDMRGVAEVMARWDTGGEA